MKAKVKKILGSMLTVTIVLSSLTGMSKTVAGSQTSDSNAVQTGAAVSQFENYITVDGTRFMDGDKELKFISLNYPQATSDEAWEQKNAVKTIKAMGGNVTRSYTIPVTNGNNSGQAYVTGVDKDGNLIFDENALNKLDQLLAYCNEYGIRLIIPLVDHWHWVGGMDGYVWLANGQSDNYKPNSSSFQDWAWDFYTNTTCIDYFKQMITHLMERTNSVTGMKYKDDPAVLCWETGNEVGGNQSNQLAHDDDLTAWNKEIVKHIKAQGAKQLVLDGRMSTTEKSRTDNPADILGAHYYEGNYATRCADDTDAAHKAGYPFILGEFGAKVKGEDVTPVFRAGVEHDTNGIMMWSLRAHKDGYGYYFHDEDGYWAAYHWPGFPSGDYYGETEIVRALYAYALVVNGEAKDYEEAKMMPIPAPETEEAPLLYDITTVGDIKWRGVVGGAWYEIQRAEGIVTGEVDDAVWTTIAGEEEYVYDSGRNWEDKAHDCIAGYHDETAVTGQTYSYRLRACNESGKGLWSNIVTVNSASHIVTDELDLIAVSSTDANPTEIRNVYSYDHSVNVEVSSSSIVNKSDTEGYIGYAASIPVSNIKITALYETAEEAVPKVYVSADDITYVPVEVSHVNGTKEYVVKGISDETNYYYTRVYLAGKSQCKLDAIELEYINDGKSYIGGTEGSVVKTNVMIQDNTFGEGEEPYYISKSENLKIDTVDGYKGLQSADGATGTLIYKTGDDINAYRIVAYETEDAQFQLEYSYDGVVFQKMPLLSSGEDGSYHKNVYGDLNVSDQVRVLRISYPETAKENLILESVELSSGTKSIPLSFKAPENVLEDGEYYFGSQERLDEKYTIAGNSQGIAFTKELEEMDLSSYDSLYAWIKGDGSSNSIKMVLTDKAGKQWTGPAYDLSSQKGSMVKFALPDFSSGNSDAELDLSNVQSFALQIEGDAALTKGSIALDKTHLYTGNYGVALNYVDDAKDHIVYVDCIYVGSSAKVDNFEEYSGSNNLLRGAYSVNSSGGSFEMSLDSAHKSEGSYGLKVEYDYKGTGYAGAVKTMDLLNLSGYDGFVMWCESDGSGNQIKIQVETDVSTFSYTGNLTGTGPITMYMPFKDFAEESWAGSGHVLDYSQNLKSVAIYTNLEGSVTSGTLYFDDIKGATYVDALESETKVTLDHISEKEITAFPYTFSGTAEYVNEVTLTIGDKSFHVPVEGGRWSYELTADDRVYNGDNLEVKAGFYYPNGTAINETESSTVNVNVKENEKPGAVDYEVVWNWNFSKDGTDGWVFDGFEPWVEEAGLTAWGADGYNAVFSYTITGIPNGIYTLGNDIKVKSNMKSAKMALRTEDSDVQSRPIDTEDVVQENQMLGDTIQVTDKQITIYYTVDAPVDANGVTFAVDNISLYLVEKEEPEKPTNYVVNGDFSSQEADWPNLPTDFTYAYEGGDGWTPIKGEDGRLVGYAENAYTFTVEQTITDLQNGIYSLSADMKLLNGVVNEVILGAGEQSSDVLSRLNDTQDTTVTIENVEVRDGILRVYISGDVESKGLSIDNLALQRTGDLEKPDPEKLPFVDIEEDAWYADAVRDLYQNQIMTGTDETHFAPELDLNRGQFAELLYRMAGTPEVEYKAVFEDVKEGKFYTDAVLWANANGIVTGYGDSGLFGPDDRITREQMATMMFRYAKYFKVDGLEVRESYDRFPDGEKVSVFASEAMEWAIGTGMISGYEDGRLAPQDYTNRAVCAVMIQRFLNK